MRPTRNLAIAFLLGLALALAADAVLIATDSQKAELWGSSVAGYWAAFGFLSFVAIVAVSKVLGSVLVSRAEDYYEREEPPDDV